MLQRALRGEGGTGLLGKGRGIGSRDRAREGVALGE